MKNYEAISVACLVALLGGLVMPKALFLSLDRGLLVWIVSTITSGILIGTIANINIKMQLKASTLPAILFPITISGFLVVRWLFSWMQNGEAERIMIPLGSGAIVDPIPVSIVLAMLMLIGIAASYVVVALSSLASRPLIGAATSLYAFGPDNIAKIRKIIISIVGIVGGLIVLWSAFSANNI